ncbi:MAG: dihydroorotate dehydrogenase [Pseudomonadota bacterium]
MMQPDLKINFGKLELRNPVLVASGTFGYGEEFSELYDLSKLGAVVTKGISLKPRAGNPMPRVIETASGLLNAIGLANVGLDVFLHEKLPYLKKNKATVIVNIFGESIEEYVALALKINGSNGVSGLELNISCPNVKCGGLAFGTDPKSAAEVTKEVRKATSFPLIVKLSPQVASIAEMAQAVVEAGADILSVINTVPGMAIDTKTKKPKLANIFGGLSGPAIKPIALKLVYETAKAVNVPIIGMGGIMNTTDAIEFFLAGASAIQIGTGNFVNPSLGLEIIAGLRQYMIDHNLADLSQIIGKLET